MSDKVEALERLAKLVDQGRISEEEYRSLKDEVLDGDNPRAETAENGVDSAPPQSGDARADMYEVVFQEGDARPDMFEVALQEGIEPEKSGWFPDPERLGTAMRFHNGTEWTQAVKPRRAPGWYGNSKISDRQRYFDGLEYTQEFRQTEHKQAPASPMETSNLSTPPIYKTAFGLGIASVFLGSIFGLLAWATVAVSTWALYSD